MISMVIETILQEPEIRVHVEKLTCKITLEEFVAMTAIGNFYRRRIVILRQENITSARFIYLFKCDWQIILIDMYQQSRYQYEIPQTFRSEIQNRPVEHLDSTDGR